MEDELAEGQQGGYAGQIAVFAELIAESGSGDGLVGASPRESHRVAGLVAVFVSWRYAHPLAAPDG